VKKYQTHDQVEATKAKAARFARDVLRDDERADDIEDESAEDYAERKGIVITDNPLQRSKKVVANGNDMTKADLEDAVDEATSILEDAYTPEASREELAAAVGKALDVLSGEDEDEDEDEDAAPDASSADDYEDVSRR
jgi:hypothetical protein